MRRNVTLRDTTLREGLDTPTVAFSTSTRVAIARSLARAGVSELEVVAPARVLRELEVARRIKRALPRLTLSGLVYASGSRRYEELEQARRALDRVDLLVPLSPKRAPTGRLAKQEQLADALGACARLKLCAGAGFPNATQVEPAFVVDMAKRAAQAGATRITVYDTNGRAFFSEVRELLERVTRAVRVPVYFHGHNDLGLAGANSLAAVEGGASGLDVTVNGLGDRAGNAALEQIALLLHLRGIGTGIRLAELKKLSQSVAKKSGVPIAPLAPVVGAYVFQHRSPAHLLHPDLFEAFDPRLVGSRRKTLEG